MQIIYERVPIINQNGSREFNRYIQHEVLLPCKESFSHHFLTEGGIIHHDVICFVALLFVRLYRDNERTHIVTSLFIVFGMRSIAQGESSR